MFQWFLDAAEYWFGYSDDSSIGSYDPARDCFVVVVDEHVDGTNGAGAGDREAPQNPEPSTPPTSLTGGIGINAQLAQARELEVKLAEEYRQVRLLRDTIGGEASAHGERACELGKQARKRIDADFNVDVPHTPPRARQKLIATATLLRAMPAISTPEAHNLHREVQALIEQRLYSRTKDQCPTYTINPMRGTTAALRAKRHPSTRAAPWGNQPTRARRQSGSGSLTHADKLRTVTPTTS
jgi:hypothetical protein